MATRVSMDHHNFWEGELQRSKFNNTLRKRREIGGKRTLIGTTTLSLM